MKSGICSLFAIIAALAATGLSAAQSPLWREGVSLVPYPREVRLGGGPFVIGSPLAIVLDADASEADRFAAGDLAERLKPTGTYRRLLGGSLIKRLS